MDLIALAVPFFLLAIVVELLIDWRNGSVLYRSNDAINSVSAGILSTTLGYFTAFLPLIVWGFVLRNLALIDMPASWFDASGRGLALWLLAALAWDFFYYWNHRLGHEMSILWAAHAVHHQSEDYNLSTALRQTSTSFLLGWIIYLPLFLIGFPLEVLIVVKALNLIYQFWVHTQLVGSMGMLDRILVTPSNHRVHHAQNERYIDKNYGGILVIWDRLFGTFEAERDDEPVVFGVRKPLASWNPAWANLQVYDYLLSDAIRATRWRDKIGIWFRRTGWRPADVAAEFPKPVADLSNFHKFNPELSPARRRYVLAQFVVVILAALLIGQIYLSVGARGVLLPCALLWFHLFTLGMLNEGRVYADKFEYLRLIVVVPIGFLVLHFDVSVPEITAVIWTALGSYILLSVLWLRNSYFDQAQLSIQLRRL